MTAELRRSLVLAGGGLLAGFALVLALFGAADLVKHGSGGAPAPVASLPAPSGVGRGEETAPALPGKPGSAGTQIPAPALPTAAVPASPDAETRGPTFDIIRVEPNGESVIAGRGAPNTTVELLRDNEPVARALIDPSGQFAIVPPALPPGNSEITLRITEADGVVRRSKESVAVVVAPKRDAKPLIALSAPDRPTVVLSQPDPVPPAPVKEAARVDGKIDGKVDARLGAKPKAGDTATLSDAATAAKDGQKGGKPTPPVSDAARSGPLPVKVVSVDAEEGGRLYVTGQAPPGATVRLYLNETLVAPGSAGSDGRLAFAIGRGVTPGDYRVRIDEVDPVSGKVKTRSEVAFAVPVPKALPPGPNRERDIVAASPPPKSAAARPSEPKPVEPRPSELKSIEAKSIEARIQESKILESKSVDLAPSSNPKPSAPGGPAPQIPVAAAPPERQAAMARTDDPRMPAAATTEKPVAAPVGTGRPPSSPPEATKPAPALVGRLDAPERTVFIPEIGTAKIARGDNLWQISRRIYGKGTRYTVIFDANQTQIRNPDLIYPGQIFVLPTGGTAGGQDGKRG